MKQKAFHNSIGAVPKAGLRYAGVYMKIVSWKEELEQLIKTNKIKSEYIYAMGSASNLTLVDKILGKYSLKLDKVLDNNPQKQGTCFLGDRECISVLPQNLNQEEIKKGCVIIYSIRFWCEMKEQMEDMGFIINKNLFILEAMTLKKKINYVLEGLSLYKKLCRKFNKNSYFILFSGPIGDNYLFSGFLNDFLKTEKIQNVVCLGSNMTSKIADLWSFQHYQELTREEILSLEFLYMFVGENELRLKILQIWEFQFHFNRDRVRFDERFTFTDTFRSYIYHLPVSTLIEKPIFPRTGRDKVIELFHQYGLTPGQTVILSPYAYSIESQPPRYFWRTLADRLAGFGYSVCLNINPETEENFLEEFPCVQFSISESGNYLEYAGYFIGMRSGFCDVTSSIPCRRIILYPKRLNKQIDYDRHRPDMDFGGLVNMGLCTAAIEMEFGNDKEDKYYWNKFAEEIIKRMSS